MGLLDILGTSWDDPKTMAALQLAGGLLGGQGNTMQRLALGLNAYGATMGAAKKAQQEEEERRQIQAQRALQAKMLEAQFADQLRAREEAAAAKQARGSFLDSIDANAGPAMPLSVPQAMRAGLGLQEIQALMPAKAENPFGKVDPKDFTPDSVRRFAATNNYADLVPRTKVEFVEGRAVDPFATQPGTVIPQRAPVSNPFNDLVVPGPDGKLQPNRPVINARGEVARAGATNVNVPINTAKPLLNTMAEGLGKQIDANLGAARAAVDTIGGAQRIRTLLDSGQVVTGPGADWRIAARQVGSVLGVGGQNNDEVLANTRKTMQQLAQFELDAAQSMKGQGAITESEREILRRAAAGMITFTQPELKALSATLEERARKRIRVHNQDVDRLGQMPDGAQLVPFYRVPEPGTGNTLDDIVNRHRSR